MLRSQNIFVLCQENKTMEMPDMFGADKKICVKQRFDGATRGYFENDKATKGDLLLQVWRVWLQVWIRKEKLRRSEGRF